MLAGAGSAIAPFRHSATSNILLHFPLKMRGVTLQLILEGKM
jgi:hypothetical protein